MCNDLDPRSFDAYYRSSDVDIDLGDRYDVLIDIDPTIALQDPYAVVINWMLISSLLYVDPYSISINWNYLELTGNSTLDTLQPTTAPVSRSQINCDIKEITNAASKRRYQY